MSFVSKIFFFFISIFIFVILIFFTFFLKENYNEDYNIMKFGTGLHEIFVKKSTFDIKKIDSIDLNNGSGTIINSTGSMINFSGSIITSNTGFYLDRLNIVDDLYVINSDYKKVISGDNGDNIEIQVGSGEYFIDIKTITNFYSITNKFFKLELIGPGKFYINTTDPQNFVIFSIDNLGKLHLNADIGKSGTDMYLFPHMYLDFHTMYSYRSNNYDILKLKTTRLRNFNLGYFRDSLFINGELNENIFNLNNFAINTIFFKNVNKLVFYEQKKSKDKFDSFKNLEVIDFLGIKKIEKYFSLFLNDSKKKIYYKNLLLKEIVSLINSNNNSDKIINKIITDLNSFKKYPKEYNEILNIINSYYRIIAINNDVDNVKIKLNFYKFMFKLQNKKEDVRFKSIMFLNFIYSYFDIKGQYSFKDLEKFINDYKDNLGSDTNEDYYYISNNSIFVDYLSFFLEQIFLSRFSLSENNLSYINNKENIKNIVSLINSYLVISKGNYSKTKKIVTGFYTYVDILYVIKNFIRYGFFEEERIEGGILYPLKGVEANKSIINLEPVINNFFLFLDDYKNQIGGKDKELIVKYERLKINFKEYFDAIKDFKIYKLNYDKQLGKLFDIGKTKETNISMLDKKSFLNFIKRFAGINLQDVKVDIVDDYYYVVKDLYISGSNFSFDLYPDRQNSITNLTINHKPISGTYKLGDDEVLEEGKDNYFIDKFLTKEKIEKQIIDEDDSKITYKKEDDIITSFKMVNLLGKRGYFSSFKLLNIKYNNIDVKRGTKGYDVNIKGAELYASEKKETKNPFLFDADFVMDLDNEKTYFKNIKIRKKIGENLFLLDGLPLVIIGNIGLDNFDEEIINILQSFTYLGSIYDNLYETLIINNITYTYYLYKGKMNIKFDYNDKTVIISMNKNTIKTIYVSGINILEKETDYKNLKKYLLIIKRM